MSKHNPSQQSLSNDGQSQRDYLVQAYEAEERVKCHRVTLLRWATRNIAPQPIKIGGRWFWRNSELEQFIAGTWRAQQ